MQNALEQGGALDSQRVSAKMTLDIPALGVKIPFEGEIKLK